MAHSGWTRCLSPTVQYGVVGGYDGWVVLRAQGGAASPRGPAVWWGPRDGTVQVAMRTQPIWRRQNRRPTTTPMSRTPTKHPMEDLAACRRAG